MLRLILKLVILSYFLGISVNAYSETNTYPYKDVCPNPAGGNMWIDDRGFYKCECVSYVAYRSDDEWKVVTDGILRFNNNYKGVHWGMLIIGIMQLVA